MQASAFDTDASSMETLLTMERLLIAEKAGVREVIQAAYRLGVLDGELKMAAATEAPR